MWLEIVIFGVLLFAFMYFVAVKGPIAGKIRWWHLKARESRKRGRDEQKGKNH